MRRTAAAALLAALVSGGAFAEGDDVANPGCCEAGPTSQAGPAATDLAIWAKARQAQCTAEGVCAFAIGIGNPGETVHSGPLSFRAGVAAGPARLAFAPSPPWRCAAVGPGLYQCEYPEISIGPGQYLNVAVNLVAPQPAAGVLALCVTLRGAPNETRWDNNQACATIIARPPGPQPEPALPPPEQPAPEKPGPAQPSPEQPAPEQPAPELPVPDLPGPAQPEPVCGVAGQIVIDGQCVCPEGTDSDGARCVAPPPAKPRVEAQCAGGQVMVDGACVSPPAKAKTPALARPAKARHGVKTRAVASKRLAPQHPTTGRSCPPFSARHADVFEFLKR